MNLREHQFFIFNYTAKERMVEYVAQDEIEFKGYGNTKEYTYTVIASSVPAAKVMLDEHLNYFPSGAAATLVSTISHKIDAAMFKQRY